MSELRQDPTTGDWVVIAYEREAREGAMVEAPPGAEAGEAAGMDAKGAHPGCPFCAGAEHTTPQELERLGLPGDREPWRVRVVPNRFPAFVHDAAERLVEGPPPFTQRSGRGAHEVVIETPRHGEPFWALPPAHAALVLEAWQRRRRALSALPGVAAVVAFKNHGPMAGASLAHAHSQIVAVPVVPRRLALKEQCARLYAERTGGTLYDDLLRGERAAGSRIVLEGAGLLAFAPFAARWPYELWLLPTALGEVFEALPPARLAALSRACQTLLVALRRVVGDFAFNLLLIAPPLTARGAGRFPWHLELVPRCIQPGGFELTTDLPINPLPPELAAERVRAALAAEPSPPPPVRNSS